MRHSSPHNSAYHSTINNNDAEPTIGTQREVQSDNGRDDELLGKYEKKNNKKRKRVTWKDPPAQQQDNRPPNSTCTSTEETDANPIPAKSPPPRGSTSPSP